MSYDLQLVERDGEPATLSENAPEGGTYVMGGTRQACFNITYNYAPHFYRVLGERGIRTIYGMTGRDSVAVLAAGIAQLGGDEDADYWKPTEGNARRALAHCMRMALDCPDAVWEGD
jgi:hypothetical protein